MVLSKGIVVSFLLHVTIVTAALAINGRGAFNRTPADYMMVSIFSEITGNSGEVFKEREYKKSEIKKKEIKEMAVKEKVKEIPQISEAQKKSAIVSDEKSISIKGTGIKTAFEIQKVSSDSNSGSFDGVSLTQNISKGISDKTSGAVKVSAVSDYSFIRIAIEKAKTYPFLARKRRLEGTVVTEFTINSNGYPENITVAKSSGSEILDSAAMNIITRAAPFPQADGHIVIPITFSLTSSTKSP